MELEITKMLKLGFSLCDTRPIMGHNLEQVFRIFPVFCFFDIFIAHLDAA